MSAGVNQVWMLATTDTPFASAVQHELSGIAGAASPSLVRMATPNAVVTWLAEGRLPRAIVVGLDALPWAVRLLGEDQATSEALREMRCLVEVPESVAIAPELRALARVHPAATLCVTGVDDPARCVRRLLAPQGRCCGTLRLLPLLDGDYDHVTADQLAFIALSGRRHARIGKIARAMRVSTAALRARFASRGLAAPVRVLAACRALHAVILVHHGITTRVAAKRLGFASRSQLLAQVRRGLGRSLRTFHDLDAALEHGRAQIRGSRRRESGQLVANS
jgi:AraC-like DNA-binding protein